VAKGYTQQDDIDYEETFSLIVRFASIRLIVGLLLIWIQNCTKWM
jgi:hypothetical protein